MIKQFKNDPHEFQNLHLNLKMVLTSFVTVKMFRFDQRLIKKSL